MVELTLDQGAAVDRAQHASRAGGVADSAPAAAVVQIRLKCSTQAVMPPGTLLPGEACVQRRLLGRIWG
jgi:hypothetical protein